jgi:hypothetical protein
MSGTSSMHEEEKNPCNILIWKREGKGPT